MTYCEKKIALFIENFKLKAECQGFENILSSLEQFVHTVKVRTLFETE